MANKIFITITKILYSSLLITCPFWFLNVLSTKALTFKDPISTTLCLANVIAFPFTLLYTCYRQFLHSDKSLSTAIIPIIPIIALFSTRFISKTLQKGSNRQR